MVLGWTAHRLLVLAVVATALAGYARVAILLFARRSRGEDRRRVWSLVRQDVTAGGIIRLGWIALVFDPVLGPLFYDRIPAGGWVILAAQAFQTVAIWRLGNTLIDPI